MQCPGLGGCNGERRDERHRVLPRSLFQVGSEVLSENQRVVDFQDLDLHGRSELRRQRSAADAELLQLVLGYCAQRAHLAAPDLLQGHAKGHL